MDKEIKEQWLTALKSGNYKKGKTWLCSVEKKPNNQSEIRYCCLGVLCDLAVKNGIRVDLKWDPGLDSEILLYDGKATKLPSSVMYWARLKENNPYFKNSEFWQDNLALLNDTTESFDKVIKAIEEEL